MNPVERVLYDDLTHLLDRVATSVPGADLAAARALSPTLRARLDDVEGRLASMRKTLLESYDEWRCALDDAENLWALAAWRSAAAEEPAQHAAALAA
jgi:hypothetical protein